VIPSAKTRPNCTKKFRRTFSCVHSSHLTMPDLDPFWNIWASPLAFALFFGPYPAFKRLYSCDFPTRCFNPCFLLECGLEFLDRLLICPRLASSQLQRNAPACDFAIGADCTRLQGLSSRLHLFLRLLVGGMRPHRNHRHMPCFAAAFTPACHPAEQSLKSCQGK